ncbi:helix-turn-helix domain-containing protein [Flavobacterium humi]|uniref:AraC family transcriptional regulator n=1 Tax=Flavobacterium humi TaxID=2562683 RepID=A0A4Z0LCQ6_9FLAO|nr:AraC family transcriptional regulator [Flavobacterium humi]TGD59670.1 AraC family transcriptional regulator [Flavobacterium humi]
MTTKIPKKILARKDEITVGYLAIVEQHINDFLAGKTAEFYEIRDFASQMFIHPTHLSNTIKLTTGKAPCYFFEEHIVAIAKNKLEENEMSISEIAHFLTFDPSNFTKFFKRFTHLTPKQYRESVLMPKSR